MELNALPEGDEWYDGISIVKTNDGYALSIKSQTEMIIPLDAMDIEVSQNGVIPACHQFTDLLKERLIFCMDDMMAAVRGRLHKNSYNFAIIDYNGL